MKIVSAKQTGEGTRASFQDNLVVAYHTEDVAKVLQANYEDRKDPNNGWSKDRQFRQIARVTELAYRVIQKHHPETCVADPKIREQGWRKAYYCKECNTEGSGQWFTVAGGI